MKNATWKSKRGLKITQDRELFHVYLAGSYQTIVITSSRSYPNGFSSQWELFENKQKALVTLNFSPFGCGVLKKVAPFQESCHFTLEDI